MARTYLGVDVGTTATRVSLLGEDGTLLGAATSSYASRRGPGGAVEQDPVAWTAALRDALGALELAKDPPSAIGLCGQTPTVVVVDAAGTPVRPALTWQDTRADAEAEELAARFGPPEPLVGTALPWSASNIPAKLMWLARHEPETRARARYVLQPKDVIGMALTGSALSDPWSSKGICRVGDGLPLEAVLEACGWDPDVCPPIAPAWSARGVVSDTAGADFGLASGTPVTVGWSDALAEMLAAGAFARASAFVFAGTSSIVGAVVADSSVRAAGLFSVPRSCAPRPLLYGPTQSGGAALAWAARLLGCGVEELLALAAGAGASLPVFVPYLSGERAPLWDHEVRAVFMGLSEEHGRAECAAAVLLGVFLGARHVLDLVEAATGHALAEIEVAGRGVGEAAWEDAAVRAMGTAISFHGDPDSSARGAAMLALALDGVEVVEASRRLAGPSHRVEPSPGAAANAVALLERYRRASEAAVAWRAREGGVDDMAATGARAGATSTTSKERD